jgi:hypothetical protein
VIWVVESKQVVVVQKRAEDEAPDGWCHIKGRIVWDTTAGPAPVRKPIKATKDQHVAAKDGDFYTEDWVVNQGNNGIKNVIVWLAPEPTGEGLLALEKARKEKRSFRFASFPDDKIYPTLAHPLTPTVEIDIPCCRYIPHVVAARAGQDLLIKNSSPVPHNSKWVSRENGDFSPLVPPGQIQTIKNLKAERFPISIDCSIHPWMKAWVRVFDHPYFAVTDVDGKFEIRFAPKGPLRLFVWQEDAGMRNGPEGRFGEQIQVPSGKLDLGIITFTPPK